MSNLTNEIKFGTDGWRGVISDNFTFANVRRVARAIAEYYISLNAYPLPLKIAVGYDTRFLSDKYALAVTEVLLKQGINVILSDKAIPTPTLSFAVQQKKLTAGIMITASHNPSEYNGIKIKTASGGAAGTEVTQEVERLLNKSLNRKVVRPGVLSKIDLTGDYVKFLRKYVDFRKLKNAKFKVLVDPMHGSGNSLMAEVLKGTKIKLVFTRQDVNPSFGGLRPEPVMENLYQTQERMKKEKFDLAIILDGDADRIAAFAGKGEFIYPQKILGLLALHLHQDRKMSGGMVKTIVGTNMMGNIAKDLGMKLYETPVGFKYISELMQNNDILVGGEEAGGMGFKNYIPERDGTLAGLLLLEMMAQRKKPMIKILSEMESKYGRYYYERFDLRVPDLKVNLNELKKIKNILGREVIKVKDYDGVKLICSDFSWLIFRASGTEPIIRIYAESKSLAQSKKMVEFGKKLVL
ncbi:MAG: phosphoglucomutase/phosphomannomutase family protein [Candidatus Omnitrophota bacterium]|nr:phosphoglucomutase/phosphomannomutase family protein [Candidatus Omnitrophota bacterium]MBU1929678.1 phosphoglucomutase/phosphomannomutase family protein [Candidatus Omnitrophota bacterium]MBU2034652.1 phosphoglucomutase/phosphomannomutase family protein [Candidatus Omnitrophota bacterium]